MKPGLLARFRRCRRGSSAVEFAIVCFPLILLCLGIVEFGRALNIRNDMAYAADMVTRTMLVGAAATTQASITQGAREAFTGANPEDLVVTIGQESVGTRSFHILTLSYPLTLSIPGLTSSAIPLTVERRIPVSPS